MTSRCDEADHLAGSSVLLGPGLSQMRCVRRVRDLRTRDEQNYLFTSTHLGELCQWL